MGYKRKNGVKDDPECSKLKETKEMGRLNSIPDPVVEREMQ